MLLLSLPFWLIDSIDPVLDFHDYTAVLLDNAWTALVSLGGLDRKGA